MKPALTLLVAVLLAACSIGPTARTQPTSASATAPIVTGIASAVTPSPTPADSRSEEAAVREMVGAFGKRLQSVSLLSPDAAQEIQEQYSGFVSPALLQTWMSDVSKAPGRMVSSPWPDRIEITAVAREGPDRYVVDGFVVEITSEEVVNGGAADRIPVRIAVERGPEGWRITDYAEKR